MAQETQRTNYHTKPKQVTEQGTEQGTEHGTEQVGDSGRFHREGSTSNSGEQCQEWSCQEGRLW